MNEIKVTSLFTLHEGIRKRSTQYGALRVSAGAAPPRALGRPPAGSGTTLAEPRPSLLLAAAGGRPRRAYNSRQATA